MVRGTLCALLGVLALCAPASAAVVKTVPVTIKASLPDDEGAPVALDGGVTFPEGGCPDRSCPGVIINHGFTGNWHDSTRITEQLAGQGYVVLRYSSRGFGATPGEVDLMGPKERQDLLDAVHWLNDPANPVVGGMVTKDDIGQFGGSYGGAHAWSLALSGDPAVRTVVPTATWTSIYDALLPNDVALLAYANGFYATGFEPTAKLIGGELSTTNNYSQEMHRWVAQMNGGIDLAGLQADLASHSPAGRLDQVKIPVFLIQGTNDGLFSQNQALDAYRALSANGVPVRLYVGGIGHPPSDGSLDSPEATHIGNEVLAWFDHYLKGADNGIDAAPPIEYSRADYFHNHWDGKTRSAYRYPFGRPQTMHFCTSGPSGGTLEADPCPDAAPAPLVNGYAGRGWNQDAATAGYAEDLTNGFSDAFGQPFPDTSGAPPTLTYDSAPLAADLDLAGVPALDLQVASLSMLPAGARGSTAAFQLDPKFYDVAPDGSAKLLTRGAFAEPLEARDPGTVTTPQHEVRFDAFGVSNLVPKGDRLRITLNTEDAPYLKPTLTPFAAVLFGGSKVELPLGTDLFPTP
ncbi:MAG: transporter related protein [Solirubrobacterales bacterium]|nr:transporter related protein [Solirubrobacterales bacterium]